MLGKSIFILFGSMLLLTGCSTTTYLGYTSVLEQSKSNSITLNLNSFEDARESKKKIGSLKNGYGIPIVHIYADNSVSDWVTSALASELKNAGYSMLDDSNTLGKYVIEGVILKAYASSYMTYNGKLRVEITVKENGVEIFRKLYATKCRAGVNVIAQSSKVAKALELNLQKVCTQFISDLNETVLAENKPSEENINQI